MPSRSAIVAICNYDFRASGTVAKAIEIATRAREAGLNAEIWTVREDGPLRARVPSCVPVIAVGQGPNPLIGATTPALLADKRGCLIADPATGLTSMRGVFAGGDIVTGGATVISAMGAGRRAARAIDEWLGQA